MGGREEQILAITFRGLEPINYKELKSRNLIQLRYKEHVSDKILKEVEIYSHIIEFADFGTETNTPMVIAISVFGILFILAVAWAFKTLLARCRRASIPYA